MRSPRFAHFNIDALKNNWLSVDHNANLDSVHSVRQLSRFVAGVQIAKCIIYGGLCSLLVCTTHHRMLLSFRIIGDESVAALWHEDTFAIAFLDNAMSI